MQEKKLHSQHLIIVEIAVNSFLLKQNKEMKMQVQQERKQINNVICPKVFAIMFSAVSFRYNTISTHTLKKFPTASTTDGLVNSPVMKARRWLDRDTIQSRRSASFNLVAISSVMEKRSKLQSVDDDTFCRHCLNGCKLKIR